jgi:cell division protein FtsB
MTSAELITELQAARPAADGALRDRVRTIAAAEPVRRPSPFAPLARFSPRRFVLAAVPATAVVLLGVAGVAGLLDSGSPQQSVIAARESTAGTVTSPDYAQGSSAPQIKAGATASDAATPSPTTGRAQRFSAQLTLSVKDVDALSDATQQALRITRDLGGYLVTVSYATSDTGVSSLTLKVPTANVQDAIVRLSGLGKIESQQVQIDDLQGQVDELTKRETALREQIARLSARLTATDLDAETRATLEARLDAARSEFAKVRVTRAQVNAEARYATIQLTLQTPQSAVVPPVPSRFDNAIDRAVEILAVEAMVVLYTLVIAGPLLLLALIAWLGRRGFRRRQDEQLLSTP